MSPLHPVLYCILFEVTKQSAQSFLILVMFFPTGKVPNMARTIDICCPSLVYFHHGIVQLDRKENELPCLILFGTVEICLCEVWLHHQVLSSPSVPCNSTTSDYFKMFLLYHHSPPITSPILYRRRLFYREFGKCIDVRKRSCAVLQHRVYERCNQ